MLLEIRQFSVVLKIQIFRLTQKKIWKVSVFKKKNVSKFSRLVPNKTYHISAKLYQPQIVFFLQFKFFLWTAYIKIEQSFFMECKIPMKTSNVSVKKVRLYRQSQSIWKKLWIKKSTLKSFESIEAFTAIEGVDFSIGLFPDFKIKFLLNLKKNVIMASKAKKRLPQFKMEQLLSWIK